jgi:hypothetical protein
MSQSVIEQALEEAYASAPQDVIIIDTLEVYHRTFDEPIRIARWPVTGPEPEIFNFKLENNAPVNAGQTVKFIGFPFDIKPPDQSTDSIGTFEIRIDGVDDRIDEYMENAAVDGGVLTATYRTFILGLESSGPASRWTGLELENPHIEGMAFVIDAAVLKWAIRPYGRLYTAMEYPGLVVGR